MALVQTFPIYVANPRNIHEGAVHYTYMRPHVRFFPCLISAHAGSRDRALVWDVWNFSPVISTALQPTANGKNLYIPFLFWLLINPLSIVY